MTSPSIKISRLATDFVSVLTRVRFVLDKKQLNGGSMYKSDDSTVFLARSLVSSKILAIVLETRVLDGPTKVVKIVHEVWSLGGVVPLLPAALGGESEIDGIESGGSYAGDGS